MVFDVSQSHVRATCLPYTYVKTATPPSHWTYQFVFIRDRKGEMCTVHETVKACMHSDALIHTNTHTQKHTTQPERKYGAADSVWANSFSHWMSPIKGWSPQASAASACAPIALSAWLSCCSQGTQTFSQPVKFVLFNLCYTFYQLRKKSTEKRIIKTVLNQVQNPEKGKKIPNHTLITFLSCGPTLRVDRDYRDNTLNLEGSIFSVPRPFI